MFGKYDLSTVRLSAPIAEVVLALPSICAASIKLNSFWIYLINPMEI